MLKIDNSNSLKLKSKIFIDKLIGIPFVFSLNLIFQLFLLFKQEKEPDNSTIKRIAVCKFMGMGSIIQSTPLLISLRTKYPDAEIIFVTIPKNMPLLECFSFVDTILTIDDKNAVSLAYTSLKSITNFLRNRIDLFIDLEIYSYFSTLFTVFCFPKYKIGFYRKESRIQLGVYSKMIYFNTKAPVKNVYLQAAQMFGCDSAVNEIYDYSDLFNNGFFKSASQFKNLFDKSKDYIVINPNASDLRIERRWDKSNYVDLINSISEKYHDKQIVLTGSSEEAGYVGSIYNEINPKYRVNVTDTSGKFSLKELVVLIAGSSLMITNDSGPMHIAFALKKKTIALFGPCSPLEYSEQQNVFFIYKNIYCSPCVHHFSISPCNGDNQCMKMIKTNEVLQAVDQIYSGTMVWNSGYTASNILYNVQEENLTFGLVSRKN
ncbi:MAG: glycosyltransferase family 9 protein [Ignavibacteriales bacterium]|nr:glycosyltransferase family 9 protein [Ignavibacteriales bacterium]